MRGGEGGDALDGGAGFDTADYSRSSVSVTVDLANGSGTGGEAAGDSLVNIEALIGSAYNDVLKGSAGANTFDGGTGDDRLEGAGGSDRYLFGFDRGNDTIAESGDALDTDRLVLDSAVRTSDVTLIRNGADLIVELEKGPGFLSDRVTVLGHFDGSATGIEEIVFANGTTWDRDAIFANYRNDAFNAADDIIRFADEDISYNITAARLTENDTGASSTDALRIISVQNGVNGTATLNADGSVNFIGAANFNGDAFFDYTVTDGRGRETTATAKVVMRAVNDAPGRCC